MSIHVWLALAQVVIVVAWLSYIQIEYHRESSNRMCGQKRTRKTARKELA